MCEGRSYLATEDLVLHDVEQGQSTHRPDCCCIEAAGRAASPAKVAAGHFSHMLHLCQPLVGVQEEGGVVAVRGPLWAAAEKEGACSCQQRGP